MAAILWIKRLLQACRVRAAILCMLYGLWSLIPLAGAEMPETFRAVGEFLMAATMAPPQAVGDVLVTMPPDNILVVVVAPDARTLTLTAAESVGAVAPLPGILMAGQGDRPKDLSGKPKDPPNPPGPPCDNPPQGCPCKNPPCGPCKNPPCGPPGSPSK
jgi:hypothetical protein